MDSTLKSSMNQCKMNMKSIPNFFYRNYKISKTLRMKI